MKTATALLAVLALTLAALAQQNEKCADHHSALNQRGDHAMGFSQEKTTHHFRLFKDGGAIEVEAKDPKDTDNRDMIRMHLSHIAQMFAAGDFDTPMFIHDTTPPGVPTMIELRDQDPLPIRENGLRWKSDNPDIECHSVDSYSRFPAFPNLGASDR